MSKPTNTILNFKNKVRIIYFIVLLSLAIPSEQLYAQGINTGVTFNWADTQTTTSDPATISSILINSIEYNTFVVPSTYELTRLGPGGHSENNIWLNGSLLVAGSDDSNWNNLATIAYQSLNLNHYFRSGSNGDDICENPTAIATTDAQIQTITYNPGIPSNPDGVLAVTERAGNNCLFVELYGIPSGGGPEQLLGSTFVRNGSLLDGVNPQAPPSVNSDYWSSGRNNENDNVIGIALFELSSIVPVGSTITSIQYLGATNDHGDGKFFLMQTYAVDDMLDTGFETQLNGDVSLNDNVPLNSVYTINTLPSNGTATVNPDGTFSYTPNTGFVGVDTFTIEVCLPAPNQAVCNISTVTITTNLASELSIADASADEGDDLVFTITNTEPVNRAIVIDLGYSNITTTDSDYTSVGTVTLPANQTSVSFNVAALDDTLIEAANETFNITISSTDTITISDDEALGTIIDNDAAVSGTGIAFTNTNVIVEEGTDLFAVYNVTLTGNISENLTVDYNTNEGSALNTGDFTNTTGTLTFTPTVSSLDIQVPITDDTIIEPQETFSITLSNIISNLGIGFVDGNTTNTANGTINDDDGGVGTGITFDLNNITVDEDAGTVTLNVVLTGNVQDGFTVDFASTNDSATSPSDYAANTGTLTFLGNDGESHPITLNIIDDSVVETVESFFIDLLNLSTNVIPINGAQATINITDNDTAVITLESAGHYEDAGTITYNFTLSGAVQNPFSISYTTSDDDANAPADYTAATGTINFSGTDSEIQTASFIIIDDTILEPTERFNITASYSGSPMGLTFADNPGYIAIIDNDFTGTYQPFVCDGKLYQSIQTGGDMILYEINTTTASLTEIANLSDNGVVGTINSIAINPIDNYMYGIQSNSPYTFYRIDTNGLVENLGNISGLADNNQSGAFDINGNYYVTGNSEILYRIDINTMNATAIGATGINVSDIAINPSDGKIYAWDQDIRQLVTIDSNSAAVTYIGSPDTRFSVFGALYYDLNNGIIAYGDDTNTTSGGGEQETLVTIDPDTGVVSPLTTGPSTGTNDGCSCVFDINFDKKADTPSIDICIDNTITYTYTIYNNSGIDLTNVNFGETLLNGLTYASEPYNETTGLSFTGSILGQSNSNLVLSVPVGESSFTIDLEMPLNYNGPDDYSNLTYLDNINSNSTALPYRVESDDPDTPAIEDTTYVEIISLDNDNDNVPDCVDLDDDNDGILDTEEGTGNSDSDSLIDAFDTDSDNDGCVDAIEAGHTDPDNDGLLGNSPVTVDANGMVTGQGGYTGTRNAVTTPLTAVSVDTQPTEQRVSIGGTATFNANVSGGGDLSYQWQESTDNGATWNDITDGTNYSGATTTSLTVSNITDVNHDYDYQLVISDAENLCDPITVANSGNLFVTPFITIDDATITEGGDLQFVVTTSHPINEVITFDLSYVDISTVAADYTAIGGGSIPANNATSTVIVPTIDDTIIEPTETFTIGFTNISSNVSTNGDTGTGTIIDNDGGPNTGIAFANTNIIVTEGIDDFAIFTVTLLGTISENVTVDYATSEGSALNPADFITTIGTLTFTPTISSLEIPVPITDDMVGEPLENFTLVLSNIQSNLGIGFVNGNTTNTANGTIIDDDVVEIMAEDYEEEMTIMCGETIPDVPEMVFTGGCGNYTVDFTEVEEFTEGTDDYMIVRTWNVSDICGNTASFQQLIFVMQPERAEISIDICTGDLAIDLVDYLPSGFDTTGNFTVTQGDVVLDESVFDPSGLQVGEYLITYEATDTACKFYADFTINTNTTCLPCDINDIVISKTVTVNGDGVNDFFEISGLEDCGYSYHVKIFNRWGTMVYEAQDYQNNWGGNAPGGSFGTSSVVPTGTYYYIIALSDTQIKPINGYIYIGSN